MTRSTSARARSCGSSSEQPLSTQAELADALRARGHRGRAGDGLARHRATRPGQGARRATAGSSTRCPERPTCAGSSELTAALRRWALRDEPSGTLLVVQTPRGYASRSPTRSTAPACRRSPARSRATTPSSSPRASASPAPSSPTSCTHDRRGRMNVVDGREGVILARCPSASASASPSRAASTRAARSRGCASAARSRTRSPPTSASTTSPTSTPCPERARRYGAEEAVLVDCKEALVREGSPRSSAARSTSRRRAAATSTRRRSAAPSPARCSCARWPSTASTSGATGRRTRATTSSASTATACSRTRTCASTSRGSTRPSSRSSAAASEMSEWLAARGLAARRVGREGVLDRREPARRDARGEGSRAARRRMKIVEPIMGVAHWDPAVEIEPEMVTVALRARAAGRDRRRGALDPVELVRAANEIGGRHGLGMSDQIENRIIEAKSRGIYEAPGMALLHIALRAAADARSTTRRRSSATPSTAAGSGGCCTRAAGSTPQALMLRESLQRWVARVVTGEVTHRAAPRRRLHDPRHARRGRRLRPRAAVAWSAARPRSPPPTGSGSSPSRSTTSPTRGAMLERAGCAATPPTLELGE